MAGIDVKKLRADVEKVRGKLQMSSEQADAMASLMEVRLAQYADPSSAFAGLLGQTFTAQFWCDSDLVFQLAIGHGQEVPELGSYPAATSTTGKGDIINPLDFNDLIVFKGNGTGSHPCTQGTANVTVFHLGLTNFLYASIAQFMIYSNGLGFLDAQGNVVDFWPHFLERASLAFGDGTWGIDLTPKPF